MKLKKYQLGNKLQAPTYTKLLTNSDLSKAQKARLNKIYTDAGSPTIVFQEGRQYYEPKTNRVYLQPNDDYKMLLEELTHALQNQAGELTTKHFLAKKPELPTTEEESYNYYNRRGDEYNQIRNNLPNEIQQYQNRKYPISSLPIKWNSELDFVGEHYKDKLADDLLYGKEGTLENKAHKYKMKELKNYLGVKYQDGGKTKDNPMVEGVASILAKVKDKNNRKEIAKDMLVQFKKEKVSYDKGSFLKKAKVG